VARTLLVVLLILLVLLVAIPLGMGMAMGTCPTSHSLACPPAVGACAAILGVLVMVLFGLVTLIGERVTRAPVLLLDRALDRPPRPSSL
jgi:hypothetical protein